MRRAFLLAVLLLSYAQFLIGPASGQTVEAGARVLSLGQVSPGYRDLLSETSSNLSMKSGLVVLAPGKSVGKHSTEDHEEMVIVLEGKGEMVLADGKRLSIGPNAAAYSPPGTEHNVFNTGDGPLRYVYVVAPAKPEPHKVHQGGDMQRVTGLGGVFFKAKDPKAMYAWYEKHLGIKGQAPGSEAMFHWRYDDDPSRKGLTVWSIFPENTKYFAPSSAPFMLNYRVENLHALLEELKAEGVTVDKIEEADYGKFAWITDPEGNRIELWEPPKESN